MSDPRRLRFLRSALALFALFFGGAAYQFAQARLSSGGSFSIRSQWWLLIVLLGFLALGALFLLAFSFTPRYGFLLRAVQRGVDLQARGRVFLIIGLLVGLAAYPWLIFGPAGDFLTPVFPRFLVYALGAFGGAVALKSFWPQRSFLHWLAAAALGLAVIHQIIIFLQGVSTYPFSLGWSETSRYYYASLFFSERLYGIEIPPSVLHPTRYAMQALPFLISGLPLWGHRLWQVILWIGVTLLTSALLARRIRPKDVFTRGLLTLWAFLFLLVGPVYYHLQVAALIVLWGFDSRKPVRSLLIVMLASAWAGVSRVNWYPVPAMLAIALYLIENPFSGRLDQHPAGLARLQAAVRYFLPPFIWSILGLLAAFAAQTLYVFWSGNDPGQFTSSFTSDLLWNRLWPNATYPLGVLPGIVLFSVPFWVLMFRHWRCGQGWAHQLRWLVIALMLLILFSGGLLVSVKIGGGSNLHNMDAYLVLLLVVGVYLFGGRFSAEGQPTTNSAPAACSSGLTILLMILIPILYLVPIGKPQHLPAADYVQDTLRRLTRQVNEVTAHGGEVLFVTQRQLAMFEIIPGVEMIPEYEVVFLMEMAMADQQTYLEQFYADLHNHRFDLIVIDPLPEDQKSPDFPFGEEHNAWLWRVAEPIRAEYNRVMIFRGIGIDLYAPKP